MGRGGGLKIQIQIYFKNLHTKMTENSPWTPPPSHPGQTIFIPRTLQPPNPPPSVEKTFWTLACKMIYLDACTLHIVTCNVQCSYGAY